MLYQITGDNFDEEVGNSELTFVLMFSSPWCEVCKAVAARLEPISEKYDNVCFGKIDVASDMEKASEFGVMSLPSILIFQDGEEKERIIGDASEKEIAQKIEGIM